MQFGTAAGLVIAAILSPSFAAAQSDAAAAPRNGTPHDNKLERVHAQKLDGFELSARSSSTGTQIGGASRGGSGTIILLAPNKGRVYTLNPLFQWASSDPRIKTLDFRLLGPDGETVLYKTQVVGTSFKYPSDAARPLKPGGDYFWTVGPPLPLQGNSADPAELIVAESGERSALTRQIETTAEGSRERADVFVQKRLWYDAIEAYTVLIATHPGDRQLFLNRAELYDQLPQTKQAADQDRGKAEAAAQ